MSTCPDFLCLLHFFFYVYAHLRDLHSFPTRRSSDLRMQTSSTCPNDVCALSLALDPLEGLMVSHDSFRFEDRKSTRLNSSHRCISYAVFCLKKKKKNMNK